MQASKGVPQRNVRPDRWPVQVAIEVADASIGFTHAGVSGQVCLGPGLPIAADAGVDEGVLQILRAAEEVRNAVWAFMPLSSQTQITEHPVLQ